MTAATYTIKGRGATPFPDGAAPPGGLLRRRAMQRAGFPRGAL